MIENQQATELEILEAGFKKQTINSLLKKGLLKKENLVFKKEKAVLKQTIEIPSTKIKKGLFNLSGKPIQERFVFYKRLISGYQKEGKSLIISFPNIISIQKAYEILNETFPNVYIYHDALPSKEKIKTWFKLQEKEGAVLITSYSGLLMPVKNLACLIIEEESSESYKVKRTPKFDTRRVAYEIFKEKDIALIYSSYIPSVETYYSIEKKLITLINKDFTNFYPKADFKTIPFKREKIFEEITKLLKENKKTLIIANKKAYASFLYCPRCDEEIECENCDTPLKVYKEFLHCEICRQKYEKIEKCPICETNLEERGIGIEKIEEFIRSKSYNVSYLFDNKDTDIKLATTIIDKEIVVQQFDRVINIYPDFYLNIQDYKGREKFFKNIFYSYVKAKNQFVLISNYFNDLAVESIFTGNLKNFYEEELKYRKRFSYPPFTKYILLTFEKRKIDINFLNELFKAWIKEHNLENIEYKGIFKGFYSKVKGKERAQAILINFKERKPLINLYEKCRKLGIKLIIEVDPVNLF